MVKKRLAISLFVSILCLPAVAADLKDNRLVLLLDEQARAIILEQMHFYMQGVAAILTALAKGDMKTVAREARARGQMMPKRVPAEVRQQLPKGLTDIGMTVHMGFDQLAADAGGFGDTEQSLRQISDILRRCSACHATYQIRSSNFDPLSQ